MALLGRDNAGDPALPRLLDELASQSDYHHQLVLIAAAAAGDDRRLGAATRHASPAIRSVALTNLAPEHLATEEALEAMLSGSAEDRRNLRRFVNRRGLTPVAEAVIDSIRDELGDREAGPLLATCTPDTARRLLPELLYAVPNLRTLARRHPTVLLDFMEAELGVLHRRQRDLLWSRVDAAVSGLALAEPDRLLRLVEDVGPSWVLPRGLSPVLGSMIRVDPSRVARLLVKDEFVDAMRWRLPTALSRNAGRFGSDDQVAIARALREAESLFFGWIGSLAPSRRTEVFTRALEDIDTSARVWAPAFLDVLPHELRHAEARRILGVRSIRESDAFTLQYTAFLPFAEAREQLASRTRRTKAEERAVGYNLLIGCARRERSPDVTREALTLCDRLRNEQDPVRLSAIQALAASPASLFDDDALDLLQQLVQAVKDARDTSPATLHQLNELAFKLLADSAGDPASQRFRFATALLDQLAEPTGSISFPRLDRVLPRGAETSLVEALMPRLEHAAKIDRYQLSFSLTQSLGKRAWHQAGLQRLLEAATTAANDSVVRTALSQWLADPHTRSARVAQVLAADESTLTVPTVLTAVVRSRQDLLDVLLRTRPLKGRFLKGDVRFVPVIHSGFNRWLPRQCEAYRGALDALIDTPGTAEWSRTAAVRTLARLPEIGAAALEPYLASPQVPLQEAALEGLAWTDEPGRALGQLLAHAGTDRARVAVAAATRCARFVPRAELRQPLQSVLLSDSAKVTARKEAARLLGDHRPPGALDLLLSVVADDHVHRDLRVAIGRSLRGFLDDDRTWRVLGTFPGRSEDEARSLLETAPGQLAPRHRPRFAELVLETCQASTQRVRAEALASLAGWARWADRAPRVACTAIDDLDTGPAWRAALGALTTMLQDRVGWPDTSELVRILAGREEGPDLNAGADRDRPSAQRLDAVLHAAAELPRSTRVEHRPELLHIADLLGDRPVLTQDEFLVRLAAVDWSEPAPAMAALAIRLDDRPLLTESTMGTLAVALGRDQAAWGILTLADATDHLIGLGSSGSGALAVQLVGSAGRRFDWPEPWRARLRTLRSHPVEDVAVLADRVWTVAE
jgi:hypothetical protein